MRQRSSRATLWEWRGRLLIVLLISLLCCFEVGLMGRIRLIRGKPCYASLSLSMPWGFSLLWLRLQLVVDTSEEYAVFAMFGEDGTHGFECGASGNEVIEDDAVGFGGEIVHGEHRPDALLGAAVGNILIKWDVQLLRYLFTDASGEVLDEVAAFGCGDDAP